MKDTKYEHIIN